MADRYQNGLLLATPTDSVGNAGRTICRWLFEWATQVLGWTAIDTNAAAWTALVTPAEATASSTSEDPHYLVITTAAYAFTAADVGSYITLTGAAPATLDGIYRIDSLIRSSGNVYTLGLDWSGVHSNGLPAGLVGMNWRLWRPHSTYCPAAADWAVFQGIGVTGVGYNFQAYLQVKALGANTGGFPSFAVGPWANWDPAGNVWLDARHTTPVLGLDNYNLSISNTDNVRIWAHGDANHITVFVRVLDDQLAYGFIYLGEMTPSHPVEDPKPVVVYTGMTRGGAVANWWTADPPQMVATGLNSNLIGKWLAEDDVTTVSGVISAPCTIPPNTGYHVLSNPFRTVSTRTFQAYMFQLLCECRTAGHMEHRGLLKKVWLTSRDTLRQSRLGASGEYLHIIDGISIAWNGAVSYVTVPTYYKSNRDGAST